MNWHVENVMNVKETDQIESDEMIRNVDCKDRNGFCTCSPYVRAFIMPRP